MEQISVQFELKKMYLKMGNVGHFVSTSMC